MRLVNIDDCNRALFYKQFGGKDSLITVESAFNMLEALPTAYDIDKVIEELDEYLINYGVPKKSRIHQRIIAIVKQGCVGKDVE